MCDDDDDDDDINDINVTTISTPTEILAAAWRWGTQHGRRLATDLGVREAVLCGSQVDWFEFPDMMWETIGLGAEEGISQVPLELRIKAEDIAWCAARAEGDRCSRMPEDEFRDA